MKNKLFTLAIIFSIFSLSETTFAQFYYCINDHLGNTRVVVDDQGNVKEYYDYYPFGKTLRSSIAGEQVATYKYTGKELDDENDLNWYDFGARRYDPEIGRWLSVDPSAEKYPSLSPYHYANLNPLRFIDPSGKEWYEIINEEGDKEWKYYKDTPEMETWTGKYDEAGKKIMEMTQGLKELLVFGGEQLSWLQESGDIKSWPAVSGVLDKEGKTQPDLQWIAKGPIPEGWYTADPAQIQRFSDLNFFNQQASRLSFFYELITGNKLGAWPGGEIAWGDTRLPLSPSQVGNRSNFFIHGGALPGSAGCIDLWKYNNAFFNAFSGHGVSLPLNVRYRRF